jgi:predicted amidohydrolase YtcJ
VADVLRFGLRVAAGGVIAVGVATAVAVGMWHLTGPPGPDDTLRVFVARQILTLEADAPTATAVAVQTGRIVAVGSRASVEAALGERPFEWDETFRDHVLVPGFIDPHVHPTLAATILPIEIVSAMEWATPRGRTRAVRGRDAFLARLRELEVGFDGSEEWLSVWGYHEPYHGELSRADLDEVSRSRPIFVWQRSVHEMFFNTRALEALGMAKPEWDRHAQADWERGRLWERGAFELGAPMVEILASPGRYRRGLSMMSEVLHRGGITTVGEQGFPQVSALAELAMLAWEMRDPETPYRFVLVPNAMHAFRAEGDAAAAERALAGLLRWSHERIRIPRHAKYYADGAIFSQLMQMSEPYLDGHEGEWLMTPDEQWSVLSSFASRDWRLHVHVNGDAGLDVVLDQLERLRGEGTPPAGVVLEHYGYARDDQHARVAALGAAVSNNAYYLYELAPIYSRHGLGSERAADISPLGGLARAGVPISFHADFPMAPAEPLTEMWVAVNRLGSDGAVWGADQRLPVELALRAVTLEAARSLGMEDEIGTIRPGKRADFTVLGADPYEVAPESLRDIPIWGTVLEGRLHPLR